jgi:hypothetical protein
MIAFCGDRGMPEVRAAGLLAMMGLFDLVGTTLSGWLTDRYDSRKLLFVYYVLRGLSLIYLPFSDFSIISLSAFAVFYGLDWIATVPPTVRWPPRPSASATARSCSAGSPPATRSARLPRPSARGSSAPARASIWKPSSSPASPGSWRALLR